MKYFKKGFLIVVVIMFFLNLGGCSDSDDNGATLNVSLTDSEGQQIVEEVNISLNSTDHTELVTSKTTTGAATFNVKLDKSYYLNLIANNYRDMINIETVIDNKNKSKEITLHGSEVDLTFDDLTAVGDEQVSFDFSARGVDDLGDGIKISQSTEDEIEEVNTGLEDDEEVVGSYLNFSFNIASKATVSANTITNGFSDFVPIKFRAESIFEIIDGLELSDLNLLAILTVNGERQVYRQKVISKDGDKLAALIPIRYNGQLFDNLTTFLTYNPNRVVQEEEKKIKAVANPENILVAYGTLKEDIDFPSQVMITRSDDYQAKIPVIWDGGTPEYDRNRAGDYIFMGSFDLSESDNLSNPDDYQASLQVTVDVDNHTPQLQMIEDKSVSEGEELSFNLVASDADGDSLTYSASGDLTEYFDVSTGIFTWRPSYSDGGSYEITFSVSDGELSASETVTITVGEVDISNFMIDLAVTREKTAGRSFDLELSNAQDQDGSALTGLNNVAVTSNIDGGVYNSKTDFDAGAAVISIALTTAETQTLTVNIEGVTTAKQLTVDIVPAAPSNLTMSATQGSLKIAFESITDQNGNEITYQEAIDDYGLDVNNSEIVIYENGAKASNYTKETLFALSDYTDLAAQVVEFELAGQPTIFEEFDVESHDRIEAQLQGSINGEHWSINAEIDFPDIVAETVAEAILLGVKEGLSTSDYVLIRGGNQSTAEVINDLFLYTNAVDYASIDYRTDLAWDTSTHSAIANDGTVTRPYGSGDISGSITLTLTKPTAVGEDISDTMVIPITVKEDTGGDINIGIDTEDSLVAPTGLSAEVNNGTVQLNVDSPIGGADYMVYRSQDPNPSNVTALTTNLVDLTIWRDETITVGDIYYYWVRVYDSSGRASDLSNMIEVYTNYDPNAVDDLVNVGLETTIIIDVLANDSDPDEDNLVIESFDATSADGITITANDDGTLTYTLTGAYSGYDTFQYTVSDGNGGTDTATVTLESDRRI